MNFRALLFVAFAMTPSASALEPAGLRPLDVSALSFIAPAARIVLGQTEHIELEVVARAADGSPLDSAPPRLAASTGTLSPPERVAPGHFRTRFTPPAERFPHVAIVFAVLETAERTHVGFIPLHLWGQGQTVARTKPRSSVTVFIGNEGFGPVVADDEGAARVPIVVPPGPERAVATSVDALGNESQKTIDLGVPPFNRLAMMPIDNLTAADGTGEARLLAFVVDKKGAPLFDAKFDSRASVGRVEDVLGLAPGMFRLVFRPGLAPRGTATVEVSLAGHPESRASATVELLTGRPSRARLESRATALRADEPRTAVVDVRLFDSANNPVPAEAASVDVDTGRIDASEPLPGGGARITWTLPADAGAATATMSVRLPDGTVLGAHSVRLLPGTSQPVALDAVATPDEPVPSRARLVVGAGIGVNVVNNDAGFVGVGPALSLLVRVPMLDGTVHAGLTTAVLQSVRGDGVERRDFPLLLEGAWRPLLTSDLTLHVGGGAGVVLSDIARGSGTRVVEPSLGAQAVVGVGWRLGPGFLEADVRAGYALNLAQFTAPSHGGSPLGLGLVLGYRFGV